MKSNAPEFLANLCEAIYAEDPLGFEIKAAFRGLTTTIDNLGLGFRVLVQATKKAMETVDEFVVVYEKKKLTAHFDSDIE